MFFSVINTFYRIHLLVTVTWLGISAIKSPGCLSKCYNKQKTFAGTSTYKTYTTPFFVHFFDPGIIPVLSDRVKCLQDYYFHRLPKSRRSLHRRFPKLHQSRRFPKLQLPRRKCLPRLHIPHGSWPSRSVLFLHSD